MENILIITGGSKGIGKGIVEAYLAAGFAVFSIARTSNETLSSMGVTQIELDLTHTAQIAPALSNLFALLEKQKVSKITLINNAGTLGRIGPIDRLPEEVMAQAIALNTTAPFILSATFIKFFEGWEIPKTIINITSGAALKPYFGWSAYCSSKAAINMLTQTIAVEQADLKYGVKALAIAPGVVDTDMQTLIRKSDKNDFKDIERFIALKEDGALNDVVTVGQKIFEMDHDENLQSGAILRVEGN